MANFVRGHRQLQNVIENNTPPASRWRDSRTKMSSGQDLQECQRSEDTSIQVRLPSGFGTNECTVIAGETQEEPILDTHRSNRNLSHHSTGSQIWLTGNPYTTRDERGWRGLRWRMTQHVTPLTRILA